MDRIDDDLKAKLLDFGALGYDKEKISSVLDVPIENLELILAGGGGRLMKIGADRFDFAVDRKLMEMAMGGDLKAIEQLKKGRSQGFSLNL